MSEKLETIALAGRSIVCTQVRGVEFIDVYAPTKTTRESVANWHGFHRITKFAYVKLRDGVKGKKRTFVSPGIRACVKSDYDERTDTLSITLV